MPYRPCVGIALFNADGLVFAGQRIKNHKPEHAETWQMPQGGIDAGEDIETAAFRELREETGTDKATIIQITQQTIKYDLPPHLMGKLWGGKYQGQEQTWVAMRFTGNDNDIDLNADDHPEFRTWSWKPLPDMLDLVVPFKREVYKQVIAAFKNV